MSPSRRIAGVVGKVIGVRKRVNMNRNVILISMLAVLCSIPTRAQILHGSGSYKGAAPGWDRGMETTMHCGNSPESWVRGSATLDKGSGILSMMVELETDSVLAGPKGRVTASISDAAHNLLYRVTSDEIGIGGKPPGQVVIKNFSSTISIPAAITAAAASLYLDAECTGSINRLFNVDLVTISRSFAVFASNFREQSIGSPSARNLVSAAFSKAATVSQPGTPSYTASLRMDTLGTNRVAANGNAAPSVAPTSLDDDPRYRANFSDQTRVWGGDQVASGTFPDAVAITGNGKICTGVVIGPQAVLTAAHCYCGGVTQTVYFGDTILHATTTVGVSGGKAMIQCGPNMQLQGVDVAVLQTNALLTIPPRAFASAALINSATFGRVVGYGIGMNPVIDPAGIKRMVDVPMASIDCAGTANTPNGPVPDPSYYHCASGRELVAGAESLDKDSCDGDSGGPLYILSQDGSLYLGATTSRHTGTPGMRLCGDGGIYVRSDGAILNWIESQGIHVFVGPSQ